MANYYAAFRSNYFWVKDPGKFEEFLKRFGLTLIEQAPLNHGWAELVSARNNQGRRDPSSTNATLCGFHGNGEDGLPNCVWDPEKHDWVDVDFLKELAKHLRSGQVAILMEAGSEKMRYICGYAWAVNSRGTIKEIRLSNIYGEAEKLWHRGEITECEY